jgi:hypothetical protein
MKMQHGMYVKIKGVVCFIMILSNSNPTHSCRYRVENAMVLLLIFHDNTVNTLEHLPASNKLSSQVTPSCRILFENHVGAVLANKFSAFYALSYSHEPTSKSCFHLRDFTAHLTLYPFSIGFNIAILIYVRQSTMELIPVAAWSKTWVCDR